mmetsp:Transcript_18025/g.30812  ORF Transcript_18025/g.30812 Transcript_18025/m.30812 type:complete len:395 (-) Transcript_18025:1520-2704(-)
MRSVAKGCSAQRQGARAPNAHVQAAESGWSAPRCLAVSNGAAGQFSSSQWPVHSRHQPSLQIARAIDSKVSGSGPSSKVQGSPTGVPRTTAAAQSGSGSYDDQERELDALATVPAKEQSYGTIALWVGAALAFGLGIGYFEGSAKAEEFFAGYILEQSLSVDNLFVFILVFKYFKTPVFAQPKALKWGILSAGFLRAIFILAGVELIQVFEPLLAIFAFILIASSYKLLAGGDEEEDDLADNAVVKFCRSKIAVSDKYDGDNFWTTENGVRVATPLLLTLAVIEISDVIFAVDSIPAAFGVTLDPFIIYSSNIFAILSLRALYGFVSTVMGELRFLDKSVAAVLGFIGVKMLLSYVDIEVPTQASLITVGLLLGVGVGASLYLPEDKAKHDVKQ